MKAIQIGVSSCLCGKPVRHDGGHKNNLFVNQVLAEYFELKPLCPELAIGMSIPRPALRLRKIDGQLKLGESKNSSHDYSANMREWSVTVMPELQPLSGYILKNASPSCGMERVKIYDHNEVPKKNGTGIFATQLMQTYPDMPIEEEGRLNDAVLRENFIQRVYVYARWQTLLAKGITIKGLMEFHQRHKLMLLAHNESLYRQLGPMVANANKDNLEQTAQQYISVIMYALKQRSTRKRHTNVLMHILGYLKHNLKSDVKQELLDLLDAYRTGIIPLIVPVTIIRHYLSRYPNDYLQNQFYLEPYPEKLMLRNQL